MTDPFREPAGRPSGGRFSPHMRPEDELVLEQWIADGGWAPGQIHPTGGFDALDLDELGTRTHTLDGQPHRLDGPAVIHGDGTEEWFFEGALHRGDDQPAVTSSTGEREWRRFGELHREGGQPAKLDPDGSAEYWESGQRHRADGEPAIVNSDGHTEWWIRGARHRPAVYGPALIRADGTEEYWENGKRIYPVLVPRSF